LLYLFAYFITPTVILPILANQKSFIEEININFQTGVAKQWEKRMLASSNVSAWKYSTAKGRTRVTFHAWCFTEIYRID